MRLRVPTLHIRDIDIRRALHAEVHRLHEGQADTLILHELGLCQGTARVDLAVVNGTLHGYEIKSEADNLERLPVQLAIYGRALDFVTIVASENHSKKVRETVPSWWGIWRATPAAGGIVLERTRSASENPGRDPRAVAELLWREEALEELENRGFAEGCRSKPRAVLWDRLVEMLPADELCSVVRSRIKQRGERWRLAP
jgi:hypothetical protein